MPDQTYSLADMAEDARLLAGRAAYIVPDTAQEYALTSIAYSLAVLASKAVEPDGDAEHVGGES